MTAETMTTTTMMMMTMTMTKSQRCQSLAPGSRIGSTGSSLSPGHIETSGPSRGEREGQSKKCKKIKANKKCCKFCKKCVKEGGPCNGAQFSKCKKIAKKCKKCCNVRF